MKYEDITKEKLSSIVEEVLKETLPKGRDFILFRGCLTQGSVRTTPMDLNLCSSPNCKSCLQLKNALVKAAEQ